MLKRIDETFSTQHTHKSPYFSVGLLNSNDHIDVNYLTITSNFQARSSNCILIQQNIEMLISGAKTYHRNQNDQKKFMFPHEQKTERLRAIDLG
jgi:hypothetical protein